MDGIYAFDLWLQQGIQAMSGSGGFTAFMDFMFAFFTFFCEELLLLLLLLIVYWTVNKKTGETLMMAMFMWWQSIMKKAKRCLQFLVREWHKKLKNYLLKARFWLTCKKASF